MNLKDKLNQVEFAVDKTPHIKIIAKVMCKKCKNKPCLYICPAENYKLKQGEITFSCKTCFECGACRIVCPFNNLDWNYPNGGFGVVYEYG